MKNKRRYPRTARLNELIREIIAEELERLNDERLELVTVMHVVVDPDLHHATVWVENPGGEARDTEVLAALEERRPQLQAAIGRQARMRRTPLLAFRPDEVERTAARVEDVLRSVDD